MSPETKIIIHNIKRKITEASWRKEISKDEIAIDNVFKGRYVEEFLLLLDQYMCTWRLLILKNWSILFFIHTWSSLNL